MNTLKRIEEYPDYYAGDDGYIYSMKYGRLHRLKGYVNPHGYVSVEISMNNKIYRNTVHRLIAKTFVPNEHNKPCVNHKDGNKTNNKPSNLEWVTHHENEIHAVKNHLHKSYKPDGYTHCIIIDDVMYYSFTVAAKSLGCSVSNVKYQLINGGLCKGKHVRDSGIRILKNNNNQMVGMKIDDSLIKIVGGDE